MDNWKSKNHWQRYWRVYVLVTLCLLGFIACTWSWSLIFASGVSF